ncbi:hypothetical protein [Thermococcus piezophilus]|uniref:Uncharacterized protein n=1 Tax=Thermococcus piezophilus TaxID=1712654 RepID=A0A172WIH3_9EURY|nr:hypothetical protein [Thermococcus piezophilus]ANF23116.1 hypothetical protein A7C91_08015 [Thermococcus piezophilus]
MGKFIIYYLYKLTDEPISVRAKRFEEDLESYLLLVNPNDFTLLENTRRLLKESKKIYVIKLSNGVSRWSYLTDKEFKWIEKPTLAYEYEVGK